MNVRARNLFVLAVCFAIAGTSAPSLWAVPVTGGTGPGGVGNTSGTSNLFLWLRGDRGISQNDAVGRVSNWADQSGYNRNGSQVAASQPALVTSLNGRPAVQTSTSLTRSLNLAISSTPASNWTVFFTENPGTNNPANNTYFLDVPGDSATVRHVFGYKASNPALIGQPGIFYNSAWKNTSEAANTGAQQLTYVLDNASTTSSQIRRGGTPLTLTTGTYLQRTLNGAILSSTYTGDHLEIAAFNSVLNNTQRLIVENYMASQYGLNMANPANDFYKGDLPINGNFDFDVFGIGNNGTNSVLSSGSDGFGIEAATLTANKWIFAGHNNDSGLILPVSTIDGESGKRWQRVWNVDNNGNNAETVTVGFNFDNAGLTGQFDGSDSFQLLYTSEVGLTNWEVLSYDFNIETGNTISFALSSGDLLNGYYTLGINVIIPAPEPSSLLLLGLGLTLLGRKRNRRAAGC